MVVWGEVPDAGSEKPEVIMLIHYLAEISDEPIQGDQTLAMQWFDVGDLPSDCSPNIKPVIEEYLGQK
jgi:hypothetical protein